VHDAVATRGVQTCIGARIGVDVVAVVAVFSCFLDGVATHGPGVTVTIAIAIPVTISISVTISVSVSVTISVSVTHLGFIALGCFRLRLCVGDCLLGSFRRGGSVGVAGAGTSEAQKGESAERN
jgi:hypothetical protein